MIFCLKAKNDRRRISVGLFSLVGFALSVSLDARSSAAKHRPEPAHAAILETARVLRSEMKSRKQTMAAVHLSLAAHFARYGWKRRCLQHLEAAKKSGVGSTRTGLVKASLLKRINRYDAALSTLVSILVDSPSHPYALVELWKTLYAATLQSAPLENDLRSIRARLKKTGMHFPRTLQISGSSQPRSRKFTIAGYNALLSDKAALAKDLFVAAINTLPSNARAHRGLGIALERLRRPREAVGAFLLYLALDPHAADANAVDKKIVDHWKERFSTTPIR